MGGNRGEGSDRLYRRRTHGPADGIAADRRRPPLIAYRRAGPGAGRDRGKGAETAKSPAEVAARAEIVMASLPTPDIVREVALGGDGVAAGNAGAGLRRSLDHRPARCESDRGRLAERGITAIDAPVSGGVAGATRARSR